MGNICTGDLERMAMESAANSIEPSVMGPWVGDVTPTTALVHMRTHPHEEAGIRVVRQGSYDDAKADVSWERKPSGDCDHVGRARVSGLLPGTAYTVICTVNKHEFEAHFSTAPAHDASKPFSFVFGSCIGGQGYGRPVGTGWTIFNAARQRQPDFFLLIGDSIYADDSINPNGGKFAKGAYEVGAEARCNNLDQLYGRYRHHLEDKPYRAFLSSTATFSIWDDHEVEDDWGMARIREKKPKYVEAAAKAYSTYWPIDFGPKDPSVPELPGRLYRRIPYGQLAELFILDTRSYRSQHAIEVEAHDSDDDVPNARDLRAPSAAHPQMETMLGAEQLQWLKDGVTESKAMWKFIVSSVPLAWVTGDFVDPLRKGRDGWSDRGARAEMRDILTHFKQQSVKNFLFITADVHFPSVLKYSPELEQKQNMQFYELGAGPLAALVLKPDEPHKEFNPEVVFAAGDLGSDLHNFGHVTVSDQGVVKYAVVDKDNKEIFTHEIQPQ